MFRGGRSAFASSATTVRAQMKSAVKYARYRDPFRQVTSHLRERAADDGRNETEHEKDRRDIPARKGWRDENSGARSKHMDRTQRR